MENVKHKFRAWDSKAMEMMGIMYDGLMIQMNKGVLGYYDDECNFVELPNLILMPYINQNDINGKEIYLGDIISIQLKNSPFRILCTVIYKKSQCQFMAMENTKKKLVYQIHHSRNIEIIGNIYENPNLLTNGNNP